MSTRRVELHAPVRIRAKMFGVVPPAIALIAALVSFLAAPGFTIVVVVFAVAMLPVGIPAAIIGTRAVARRLGAETRVGTARAHVFVVASGAWGIAWLLTPITFVLISALAGIFMGQPAPDLSLRLVGTSLAVSFPLPVILVLTSALLLPWGVRRRDSLPEAFDAR